MSKASHMGINDRCVCKLLGPKPDQRVMFVVRGSDKAAQQNETVDEETDAALALSFQPGMYSRVSGQKFTKKQYDSEEGRLARCSCHSLNSVVMVFCT